MAQSKISKKYKLKIQQRIIYTPRVYRVFLDSALRNAETIAPRGIKTHEVINAHVIAYNPIDRIVTSPVRKMNIAFGFAEFFSMLLGIDDINFFTPFIKNYDKFSTDGVILDGAYGTRINFNSGLNKNTSLKMVNGLDSQIFGVIDKLRNDQNSRQAVITISDKDDIFGGGGTNTPCTLSMQFLLRNKMLNCITTMRSNDIIKGTTYDIFFFTLIQEFVARQIGSELGSYFHNVGSLHAYQSDEKLIENIQNEKVSRWPFLMNDMPAFTKEDIEKIDKIIRATVFDKNPSVFTFYANRPSFWSNYYAWEWAINAIGCMGSFISRSDKTTTLAYYSYMTDASVKHVLRYWLGHIRAKQYKLYGDTE